ncbi:hypothetical protein [Streptomyces chiangmaiensis]|uniref:Restriction endonuclease n=1 Tax=Streptomyces chiangmaiensis TaxID=766497 RepID=A0ABU7F9X9_9ACTN|nr:hypothetical protein [Streptomyces chiangmaiensis]MED7820771.1 hypothetical protein [Streptomyces chiangmaiensis]
MPESVPVCCPACRREHLYTAPAYPCPCGAPVTPPLDRLSAPRVVTRHTWDDAWVTVRCGTCGRADQWPRPELGCPCGTILLMPVHREPRPPAPSAPMDAGAADPDTEVTRGEGEGLAPPVRGGSGASPRGAFRPVAIRTARDAVTAAALYLRWLGYRRIRRADQRQPNGIGLAARGILAQVDPTVHPATLRDVECLWLTAMSASVRCAYFSLAGYDDDARYVADRLAVPLFVLDLTGTPQPVNDPADELAAGRA